jgi:signal transduction histidine kinase
MDDEGRALVDIVGEEAERLNRIVADLLGFARPSAVSLGPASLGAIVEEAVRAALAGLREPVDVAWELAPDLPSVTVDAGLVRQALINVVLNAAQAMPRGGRLRVVTSARDGWATIEVADTGPGIPVELRERIFEPFFTTRTSGTGLGLAIVRHVVEVHGGAIDVASPPEGGTRFALRFPLVQAAGGAAQPPVAR